MSLQRLFILIAALMWTTGSAFAQAGTVEGTVSFEDGAPAAGAFVTLAAVSDSMHGGGHHGGGHHGGMHVETEADENGDFSFTEVDPAVYTVMAMVPMSGFDSELIDIIADQTTTVELTLEHHGGHGGHGEHHGDSLTVVELAGVAIVVEESDHPHMEGYFLDVDNDDHADYRLGFGPPWYSPDNGNTRPEDGDEITVVGGLMGYMDVPMVVVYELNGEFWREPFAGHGGHGGGWHDDHGCDVDDPEGIELSGVVDVLEMDGPHHDNVVYHINVDDDVHADYRLDFGAPDYNPGNGAMRPEDGEDVDIVGGLLYCGGSDMPWVIVYEINGMFWRSPGDTTGLGPLVTAIDDDHVSLPMSFLTVRNYPNPFNPSTTIEYSLASVADVTLKVFDVTGREVAELDKGLRSAGVHSITWDAAGMASGQYFIRVSAGDVEATQPVMLLK